jgi:hypothetical protein
MIPPPMREIPIAFVEDSHGTSTPPHRVSDLAPIRGPAAFEACPWPGDGSVPHSVIALREGPANCRDDVPREVVAR